MSVPSRLGSEGSRGMTSKQTDWVGCFGIDDVVWQRDSMNDRAAGRRRLAFVRVLAFLVVASYAVASSSSNTCPLRSLARAEVPPDE